MEDLRVNEWLYMLNDEHVVKEVNVDAIKKEMFKRFPHFSQRLAISSVLEEIEKAPSLDTERDYKFDEWCTDCKEYDKEKKCCPRWNRVIRSALDDSACDRKKGKWITHRVLSLIGIPMGWFDECSECGKRSPEWRGVASYHGWNYCPFCGADMRERKVE